MEEENKFWLLKKENWWIFLGILVIAVAIATPFAILYKLGWKFDYEQFNKLGVVGDFFGGTTVGLFTLASIMFVIAAIVMQKKELALQRIELQLTRDEFSIGNNTAKVQQIDNAFFNMLTLHHQIINHISTVEFERIITGREAIVKFKSIYESMLQTKQYSCGNFNTYDAITQETLDEVYGNFHNEYGNNVGHYMRNNYRIVKFIVNNVAENEEEQQKIKKKTGREPIIGDRRYYFGMLRAQWSNAEFELILINSLYSKNYKFKKLILEYDVLDILETSQNNNTLEPKIKLKESMQTFIAYASLIEE
ncbi:MULTISPECIES: putative phage abortive infection protein [Bacillus cereus group]|uniref:putative phage abortive infection protein n=1 Tax=Bacillus cereus group TaxID=86661 RepID=UPI001F0B94B2|nr:putative phage abortive infection protein [Bacillus cereus]MDA2643564.1 putative phage abortive infection protein [Bacillus cereus]MDZ4588347.1 putative phage abortive infection protein [Bacillus cereus]MDZ4598577.1 putative phage abortive infection protein [Bacillus cereus]